uniref:Uncharacterized protein n=1 Tax=Aegilops tauschii subsp. strangulata TaxID=200361 RepID=A0A453EL39_AEGTS
MSGPILILLIGLSGSLDSKVLRNPKDRSRHSGQSCSPHDNSNSVQGALSTVHPKTRMEMALGRRT